MTSDFVKDPKDFAGKYAIYMVETNLPGPLKPTAAAGHHQALAAAAYIFRFAFDPSLTAPIRGAECSIHNDTTAPQCYFLPYKPDAATSMQLGNAAHFFFTSSLSGCSVRAQGPSHTPTVIHANAGAQYKAEYAYEEQNPPHGTFNVATDSAAEIRWKTESHAENMANMVAQAHIGALLNQVPAGGGAVGTMTKMSYSGQLNPKNLKKAKSDFPAGANWSIKQFDVVQVNLAKAELGSFVFGYYSASVGWKFYYQSTVKVRGKKNQIFGSDEKTFNEEVVLGPPVKFYG